MLNYLNATAESINSANIEEVRKFVSDFIYDRIDIILTEPADTCNTAREHLLKVIKIINNKLNSELLKKAIVVLSTDETYNGKETTVENIIECLYSKIISITNIENRMITDGNYLQKLINTCNNKDYKYILNELLDISKLNNNKQVIESVKRLFVLQKEKIGEGLIETLKNMPIEKCEEFININNEQVIIKIIKDFIENNYLTEDVIKLLTTRTITDYNSDESLPNELREYISSLYSIIAEKTKGETIIDAEIVKDETEVNTDNIESIIEKINALDRDDMKWFSKVEKISSILDCDIVGEGLLDSIKGYDVTSIPKIENIDDPEQSYRCRLIMLKIMKDLIDSAKFSVEIENEINCKSIEIYNYLFTDSKYEIKSNILKEYLDTIKMIIKKMTGKEEELTKVEEKSEDNNKEEEKQVIFKIPDPLPDFPFAQTGTIDIQTGYPIYRNLVSGIVFPMSNADRENMEIQWKQDPLNILKNKINAIQGTTNIADYLVMTGNSVKQSVSFFVDGKNNIPVIQMIVNDIWFIYANEGYVTFNFLNKVVNIPYFANGLNNSDLIRNIVERLIKNGLKMKYLNKKENQGLIKLTENVKDE